MKKIAEGNTAEIFMMENGCILKLFKEGYSQNAVECEYNHHCLVNSLMVEVPQIYEMVEKGGRYGLVMEYVRGESLASHMMQPKTFEQAMDSFVRIHTTWLSKCSKEAISYKQWIKEVCGKKEVQSDLSELLHNLPEGNVLCHGDFHPYNVILTEQGRQVVIDFANVCRGPKEYDIARTYFLLNEVQAGNPIADIYLQKMGIRYQKIERYVEILKVLRVYE